MVKILGLDFYFKPDPGPKKDFCQKVTSLKCLIAKNNENGHISAIWPPNEEIKILSFLQLFNIPLENNFQQLPNPFYFSLHAFFYA